MKYLHVLDGCKSVIDTKYELLDHRVTDEACPLPYFQEDDGQQEATSHSFKILEKDIDIFLDKYRQMLVLISGSFRSIRDKDGDLFLKIGMEMLEILYAADPNQEIDNEHFLYWIQKHISTNNKDR